MLMAEREVSTSAVGLGRRLDLGLVSPDQRGLVPCPRNLQSYAPDHFNHEAGFVL